jgi:hypothetical protein
VQGRETLGIVVGVEECRQMRSKPLVPPALFSVEENVAMEEYDLYINVKKPAIGLYVRKGASLPDLADRADWVFDGTAAQDLLPPSVVEGVVADGHAFRDMD